MHSVSVFEVLDLRVYLSFNMDGVRLVNARVLGIRLLDVKGIFDSLLILQKVGDLCRLSSRLGRLASLILSSAICHWPEAYASQV